ncbi:MAG: hypothetical protein P8X95_21145 [Anaerolineales bacterium]|jgi:hypothetical protein
MKVIGGSILAGLSLFAEVLNEWFSHFFYALFQIARGMALGAGGFSTPPAYANPYMSGVSGFGVQIFILTRILIWVFMALGILLVVWGLREKKVSE